MNHKILLFRILGNDLGSLHGENQTYDNLLFTLQNEPEFKNTTKIYLLNRIYDNKKKKKIVKLLEKYNAEYIDLPFEIEEFNKIKFNNKLLEGVKYKDFYKDVYYYNLYIINNNGARNYCIDYGKKLNYDYIFPLDSNSYFTQDLFEDFYKLKDEDYIIIPQIRLADLKINNNQILKQKLNYDKFPIQEPQIGFHKNTTIVFNEKIPYGFSPKAELLRVLQVPGKWNKWNDSYNFYQIKDRPKIKANYKIFSKVIRLNPNNINNGKGNFKLRVEGVRELIIKIKNENNLVEGFENRKNDYTVILLFLLTFLILTITIQKKTFNKRINKYILFFLVSILYYLILNKTYEHFSQKKYINFDANFGKFGLSHHKSNLVQLIFKAYELNKILIMPRFILTGKHNNNKEIKTNLETYFDLDNIIVNDKKIKIIYDDKEIEKINKKEIQNFKINNIKATIRKKKEFKFNNSTKLSISYNSNIINLGNKITSKLNIYTCVHIRRTDRNNHKIDYFTKTENILKKLKEINSPKNIYIMTDEKTPNFFDKLKEKYNVKFYSDFKELKNIKDNYYLFCIEKIIMKNANKRISTFKTKNNNYYNNYLVDKMGWQ